MTKSRRQLLGNIASPNPDGLPAGVRQRVAEEVSMAATMTYELAGRLRGILVAADTDAEAVDDALRDVYDLAGVLHARAEQWRSNP